ncbi:Ivy family c-type lysozyme inhibitor [Mixta mediterraneensis]|uniref:Ivy family c-type lysozyme inhibitor n=1 Tax=Mixta mediterraneensis TaxID=2758443 RepID=UPI0018770AE2|nr:Ivy family c-type lysozyme inhibitor [Mixta mediterraneensis]MBE5254414.1 C-lysozyme inhibitor [Mixta mediterraneensis]
MKHVYFFTPLLLAASLTAAAKQPLPTLQDFATGNDTKVIWHKLTDKAALPGWVKNGGTTGASYNVRLDDESYIVMSGCKPHDCAAGSIAVLWSPRKKETHALYSSREGKADHESLTWLNLEEGGMADERAILFAKITGSLDNHPIWYHAGQ